MDNLPNQNPAQQDQNQPNTALPGVKPQVPTQQPDQTTAPSSPVQPSVVQSTIEPIVEEKSDQPSPPKETETPPQEPTGTPMVYKTNGKKEKILKGVKIGGIVLSVFFLSSLTYLSLSWLTKKKTETTTQPAKQILSGLIPTAVKNLQLVVGEKKEVTEWKQPSEIQNTEVAKEVLDWLDEQRDSRDVYIYGYRCAINGDCEKQEADNRAGLAAIWGRSLHHQATNNDNDLLIINKDINIYTDPEKVPIIQNNFWNCKLMYQVWQNDSLSNEQKTKVKNICDKSSYYPPELEEIDNLIESDQLEKINPKTLIDNISSIEDNPQSASNNSAKFIEYSTYSSDFTAKYLWEKDKLNLNRAQAYFNKAILLWKNEPRNTYLEGKCLLGIAALDLYTATQEENYLEFAASFLDKEKVKDLCLSPNEDGSTYYNDSILEHATCGIFANQLANLKGEEEYKEVKNSLVSNAVDNLLNYPQYSEEEGKSAFFGRVRAGDEIIIFKLVRENGLFAGLLMME